MGRFVDYGGDSIRSPRRVAITKEKVGSFRCRDCQTLAYVTPREWGRARKPHCKACGGPLVETKALQERELGTDHCREVRRSESQQTLARIGNRPRCWSCGFQTDDSQQIAEHIKNHPLCIQEYRADKKLHFGYVQGTAFVEGKKIGKWWVVKALAAKANDYFKIGRFPLRQEADVFAILFNANQSEPMTDE